MSRVSKPSRNKLKARKGGRVSILRRSYRLGFFACILATALYIAVMFYLIFTSGDAQAGIAILFLPFIAAIFFGGAFVFLSAVFFIYFFVRFKDRTSWIDKIMFIASIVLVVVGCYFIYSYAYENYYLFYKAEKEKDSLELTRIYTIAFEKDYLIVLEQLALNPNAPEEVFYGVYNYTLENDKYLGMHGYSSQILNNLAYNDNIPEDLVLALYNVSLKEGYIWRPTLAEHPLMPPELLREMYLSYGGEIRYALLFNLNTPCDVVEQILEDESMFEALERSLRVNKIDERCGYELSA